MDNDARDLDVMLEAAAETRVDQDDAPQDKIAGIERMVVRMQELTSEIEHRENVLKILKREREDLRMGLIPDAMKSAGLVDTEGRGKLRLSFGGTCYLRFNQFADVAVPVRDAFRAWCEEHDLVGRFYEEQIQMRNLRAFAAEMKKQGTPLPTVVLSEDEGPVPLISAHEQVYCVVPRSKEERGDSYVEDEE